MESRTCDAHPDGRSAVSNHKAMAYICTMRVWHNARLFTPRPTDRGLVAAEGERIVYAGPADEAPDCGGSERIDCEGRWITPGLIDCHTHLVYAGNRAHEFEMRLKGATYEEIAHAGGGIVSSVKPRRSASEAELAAEPRPRRRVRTNSPPKRARASTP